MKRFKVTEEDDYDYDYDDKHSRKSHCQLCAREQQPVRGEKSVKYIYICIFSISITFPPAWPYKKCVLIINIELSHCHCSRPHPPSLHLEMKTKLMSFVPPQAKPDFDP